MNKYWLVALSVSGGILSGLAWTDWCTGTILLVALVPFFLIENYLFENPKKVTPNASFLYTLPGFVVFSIIGIGWMRIASLLGAIAVIMGLSFLMSFTFWLFHNVRLKSGDKTGYLSIVAFWLGYEFLSLNVNIISPWLNLGNGLAKDIKLIQWYEITGTGGGSLWILLSNILLSLFIIKSFGNTRKSTRYLFLWGVVIIVPAMISIIRYNSIKDSNDNPSAVVIIQPNIDPYSEKFNIPFKQQLQKAIDLSLSAIDEDTRWLVAPETTVDDPVNLHRSDTNLYIGMIKELTDQYPELSVVMGLVSYIVYPPSDVPPTISARKTTASGLYSDHYNSAFKLDTGKSIEVYNKSKLVPGIEMQFSNGPGRLLAKILPKLGGTSWGYGTQKERTCFTNGATGQKIGPIICYESVFGEFVTDYINNGAEALFIITNDGWWKNTNGYKQHLSFASLRAIETRREIVRSANTGISAIIDIRGKRLDETLWWTKSLLKGEIHSETRISTYVKYGDYILRIASLSAITIILIVFIAVPVRKKIQL